MPGPSLRADEVYVTDIYAAEEKQIEGVTPELIYKHIDSQVPTYHFKDKDKLCEHFWDHHKTQAGVVITIGAGDVYQIAQKIASGH